MRKGKKALLMLGGSVLTAVLMIAWPVSGSPQVETAVVQSGELIQSVQINGMARYRQEQPCISLKSGVISRVYARAGQPVQRGELLFQMDTQAEEQALSSLYEMRHAYETALRQLDGAVTALTLQKQLEWQSRETQLLASINASHIRAAADGVVEAVYVQEGEYAAEKTLLGITRGCDMQIAASVFAADVPGLSLGAAAVARNGSQQIPLVLSKISPLDDNGMLTLCFEAGDEAGLDGFCNGETVEVELIAGMQSEGALIPIAAVDADGMVWVVEKGRAYHREIVLGECNRFCASAEPSWVEQRVVLHPETYHLKDGMPVQVEK